MDNATALPKAVDLVINAIFTAGIPGIKKNEAMLRSAAERLLPNYIHDSIYVEWDQGWAVGASLQIQFEGDRDMSAETRKPGFKVTCEIGWCSSRYDVATAQKVATLHTAVINLAEKIERITQEFAPATEK